MALHPDITRKDDVTLAMDTANAAVRIASRQLTGNAGTVEIPNADGTSTIMGVGAGDTGVAPWVGDTIAPGKPLGITAESHNGAVWVSWDGTLDGGIPADFDHVQFTAVDGSKTVDMGQLTAAGKVTAAELTAGDTVTITAIAYDNAHDSTGASTPNASAASTPVTVVVQSAVDASVVKKAQDDAQSALDKAGRAVDTATASKQASEGAKADAANAVNTANSANDTSANASSTAKQAHAAAQGAQTTADGKNKIFSANSEPPHDGLVPGDLWFQLDSSSHVTGIQTWNGSRFVDYLVVANEILVAGSVGTTQIANGAITTDLLTSNAVTAIKIAAQTITGDKLNVGSVASAIITSGLFQTASSGARVKIDSSGIKGYDANGSMTFEIDATTGNVAMIGKFYSGDPSVSRVIIDDDYNKIDDPQYVDVDGYVAFESPSSDESPFIGGTHGTQTGKKYTGTIVTSGVTDSKTPSGASIQLASLDNGAGSRGTLASNMDKGKLNKNAAKVDVHSGKDGQMASLMAIDGTDNGNYAAVKAYVESNGNHNVDIVATDIRRVDPMTGSVSELFVGDTGWIVCYTGNSYYRPQAGSGLQALSVCKRFGVVELMGRISVGGTVQQYSDMGVMIPVSYRPTAVTMIQCDQSQWGTHQGPPWLVRPDGHIIWGPHQDYATDATFHGMWVGA